MRMQQRLSPGGAPTRLSVALALLLLTLMFASSFAIAATYKEIQVMTFRQGNIVAAPKWGYLTALARNGKAAIVAATNENSVQFLIRAPYGWIEHGPRVRIPGADKILNGVKDFGCSVGISGDGKTAIVGGSQENGLQGAAWVFVLAPNRTWVQHGPRLNVPTAGIIVEGSPVAISDDGNTIAVGASTSSLSTATVFVRSGAQWTLQQTLVAFTVYTRDGIQKQVLSLSANGNRLASSVGLSDNSGAVFVYRRIGVTWIQHGSQIVGSGVVPGSFFGRALSLSANGAVLVVGGWGTPGPANQTNMGAVWRFTSKGNNPYVQQGGPILPFGSLTSANARFGSVVTSSKDGTTFVVGAPYDDATSGSFFVYTLNKKKKWIFSKIAPSGVSSAFGTSLAISGDATVIITGAPGDDQNNGTVWFYDTKKQPCTSG